MQTEWSAWLAQLASDGKGGPAATLPAIERGKPYAFIVSYAGDFTADAFSGAIRLSPDAPGAALAEFTVSIGSYAGGETPVRFSLADTETNIGTDGDVDGLVWLVYAIIHTPSGADPYRAQAGLVPVSGAV